MLMVENPCSISRITLHVHLNKISNNCIIYDCNVIRPGVVKLKDFSAYIDVLHKDNNKMFSDGFKVSKAFCCFL